MMDLTGNVDASIPLQAGKGVPAFNPLAQAKDFAETANAFNRLQMFPGALQMQQQQLESNKTTLTQQKRQAAFSSLVPLLGKQGPLSIQDATTALAAYEAAGGNSQPVIQELTRGMPSDPAQYDAWVRRVIAANSQTDPTAAVKMVTPSTQTLDRGSETVPINIAPPGSATPGAMSQPSGSVPMQLSPGQRATRVTGPRGPKGEETSVPLEAVTPPSITGLPSMGTGRARDTVPGPLRNPNAPPSALPGQVTTGVGPGQQAALSGTGTASAGTFARISDEGRSAVAQQGVLQNMLADLPNFNPGSNAEGRLAIKKFINTWTPTLSKMATFGQVNWEPFKEGIAAQESFDKFANQLANAQGAGSDARLQVNQGANPHSGLSREGADFVLRQLMGNSDYLLRRQQLAAAWPNKDDAQAFEAKMAKELDPRVFQFARLTPEQKRNYYNGIPADGGQRKKFQEAWKQATENGWVTQ